MRFDPKIKARFDVQSRSGEERIAPCPFHNDGGKPNLYINARTGLYYCHSCGARGHVGKTTDGVPLSTLKERLAEVGKPVPEKMQPRSESWLDRYDNDHPYWQQDRGFSARVIKQFRLGYDPMADMLTIPIRNVNGMPVGVIHRRTPDQIEAGHRPKYFHPTGFKMGRSLFGISHVTGLAYDVRQIAVCEGPLDAIACWDAGFPAVALYGARMTEDQARILRRAGIPQVVCMTDNDPAGDNAVASIHDALPGVRVRVGMYRPGWGKDPGELTAEQRLKMFTEHFDYRQAMV